VAKGIRKTTSRFGGRLEPFTHVNLMLYRGRGSLDTITQAEIIAPHRAIRAGSPRLMLHSSNRSPECIGGAQTAVGEIAESLHPV
jgi:recombinational DNA repair protein (RecF pathway)